MTETASWQQNPLITWVVIADSKHAQIHLCHKIAHKVPLAGANPRHLYEERPDFRLTPLPNGALKSESVNDYQIGHSRSGSASHSISSAHNNAEPHDDINEELQIRFTKSVAAKLQQACTDNLFDRLVLVAAPNVMAALTKLLDAGVTSRIVGTLPKNLMNVHGQSLITHLQDTLKETTG